MGLPTQDVTFTPLGLVSVAATARFLLAGGGVHQGIVAGAGSMMWGMTWVEYENAYLETRSSSYMPALLPT